MLQHRLKEPFGKAGLTVAILALVFALVGGAYAAGGLTKSQEKQVTKIAKKYAGKPGATGPAGPAGSNGTNGTNGKDGAPGAKGEQGIQGIPGTNGTTGFTKTLPSKETLKGDWSLIASANGAFEHVGAGVSFGIPLSEAPVPHYLRTSGLEPVWNGTEEEEVAQSACPGSAEAPKATPGNLCVYASAEENVNKNPLGTILLPKVCSFGSGGDCLAAASAADNFGFGVVAISKEEGAVNVAGSWAVTAK
jgi:hypothetical protein